MTTYLYPKQEPLQFWRDVPKGKLSFNDRKYHSLDVKLNPSELPKFGLSPLFNLYEGRPMSVYDDINFNNIVPSDPRAARATYDQKNRESEAYDVLLQAMTKVDADDKNKINPAPAVEPDAFIEDPTLSIGQMQTSLPDLNSNTITPRRPPPPRDALEIEENVFENPEKFTMEKTKPNESKREHFTSSERSDHDQNYEDTSSSNMMLFIIAVIVIILFLYIFYLSFAF